MIENPRAAVVRAASKLQKRTARSSTGLFLLEGPQALSEAVAFRRDCIEDVFVTADAAERVHGIVASIRGQIRVHEVSDRVLESLADTVSPQGVVAVCKQFPTSLDAAVTAESKLVAILHEIRDPGNLGTIIRVADAAGADAVIVTASSVDVFNPKVVRATTGSLFHLPIVIGVSTQTAIDACQARGQQILAADIAGDDLLQAVKTGSLEPRSAWVFGNEARGLPEEVLDVVDVSIAVPNYGHAESMNLATAASVCLYQSAFAQRSL
ncbi:TrmH family RNA methyltransferase [Humidisolicoccus flavus]|uniref:TrmH family RNA methyltransferase n=1 Tax=Humidisolicoccus flavus TaxID=3111414 RepID=UPI0032471A84